MFSKDKNHTSKQHELRDKRDAGVNSYQASLHCRTAHFIAKSRAFGDLFFVSSHKNKVMTSEIVNLQAALYKSVNKLRKKYEISIKCIRLR